MSGIGGNNDFVEEKCAPIRRGGPPKNPPPGFPMELKPKFPKPEEIMPVVQQPQVPPQTPIVEASPGIKTVEQEGDAAPVGEVNSGNQEVSKDVDTPDNFEPRKKAKKKSKKPTKKKDETGAMAVFMEDDEPPKNDGNNAIGQFIDEEEEKKEKTKKEEKKSVKPSSNEKEKDSNRDKEGKDKEKEKEKPKVKKQKQPRTESLRQKQKAGTTQSGRQRKMQASVVRPMKYGRPVDPTDFFQRKTNKSSAPPPPLPPPSAKPSLTQQALAAPPAPPPKPPAPIVTPEQKAAKEKERLAREPNEGFLKAMYARAKQKIVAMSKNPNYVPSETCISDDTLIATDAVIIKPEVTAVYGAASDYPKCVIPPKNDKSHPDKLFPGGRPFWMNRDEKPPQAKVITMTLVESGLKQKTLLLTENPVKKGPFTPYCENYLALQRTDHDHFSRDSLILSNAARNWYKMRSFANKVSDSEKLKPRKKSTVRRKPKPISIPPMCQVYNRKDQKKKPPFVNKPVTMGCVQKKKKKKSSGNNSITDKE